MESCQRLAIQPQSFKHSNRLQIVLQNITDLHLMRGSFEMDALRHIRVNLTITNSTFNDIPSNTFMTTQFNNRTTNTRNPPQQTLIFQVHNSVIHNIQTAAFGNFILKEFYIVNSTLGFIASNAVNNSITKRIQLVNTTVRELERNAIVLHNSADEGVLFENNQFEGDIAGFLSGSIMGDVYISNNSFPSLKLSPWNLTVDGDVHLRNNTFTNIPKHGLLFTVKHRINITDNDIQHLESYAFQGILPEGRRAFLFLDGNVIHEHDPMSLCLSEAFDESVVVIRHNLFHQKCSCNITEDLAASLGSPNATIEDLYKDGIHQQWFRNGECLLKTHLTSTNPIDKFLANTCFHKSRFITVLLLVFAIILITLTICVIVAWRRIKQKNTITPSASAYQSFTEPQPPSQGPSPWQVVQPDPRTYQETEIHIVFDKAEELCVSGEESSSNIDNSGHEKENKANENKGKECIKGRETLAVKVTPTVRHSCPPLQLAK
ncbi:uncharacterized protein LOC121859513 isoform X2 [Homarus americanus]|nr:uncharacterized protein LOC121859513 isoform X2 [Homarus americanus]